MSRFNPRTEGRRWKDPDEWSLYVQVQWLDRGSHARSEIRRVRSRNYQTEERRKRHLKSKMADLDAILMMKGASDPILRCMERYGVRWRETDHSIQFLFPNGAILCWWPRTRTKLMQGKAAGEDRLLYRESHGRWVQQRVEGAFENIAAWVSEEPVEELF